jgi:hypothetical protein
MIEKNIEPLKENETKAKPLVQQLKELQDTISPKDKDVNKRKVKILRKAKVRKRRLKKGWIGILRVDENRNITGEKQRVSGNAYMTSDGTYHGMEGDEILFWEGKFPVVIQFSNKTRPTNFENFNVAEQLEKNETFADRYKMAKMLADTIKVKTKGGSIIIWIIIAGAILFGLNYLLGGGLFG